MRIDLQTRYQGMEKQLGFIVDCIHTQTFFFGGFGNGKTEALCWRLFLQALAFPMTTGLLGRATYRELADSTLDSFFKVIPDIYIAKYNKTDNEIILQNGAKILARAFDDPRKVLSLNLGYIGVDQIEEISEDLYLLLLSRLRDKNCRFFSGVGNPESNWTKTRLKDSEDPNIKLYEATTLENPHLPDDYVETLKRNYPEFWQKRYIWGDWAHFEGMVFANFSKIRHIITGFEIPDSWDKCWVVDYGYRNPLCCLEFRIDNDGVIYITQEHYESEQVISYHANKIKEMGYTQRDCLYIDPSCSAKNRTKNDRQISIIDEFMEEGIYPIPADNNRAGIYKTNSLLAQDKIKVFNNCKNTIKEFEGWRWKRVKANWDKNMPEEPEDRNDHAMDCVIYYVNSRPDASDVIDKRKQNPLYKRECWLKQGKDAIDY